MYGLLIIFLNFALGIELNTKGFRPQVGILFVFSLFGKRSATSTWHVLTEDTQADRRKADREPLKTQIKNQQEYGLHDTKGL